MIAMPECNHSFFYHIANGFASLQIALSIFSENIKIARDMKAKGWMIGDAIDNGGCITNNHMVFAKYKYVRSIKQLTSEQGSDSLIIKANEDMWSNLSRLYTIIYSRSRAETLQHFKDNYSDLLLPTRNPPNYDYLSDDQLSSNSRRGLFSSGSMSPPSYPQRINSMDSGSDPLPLYEPRQSSDSTN
ncbi:hypothetical protein BDF19DRAFT_202516 [Syncephalis fuscata]|nr:hypothetical protein BDF19DRAFT_202516 [Syncephalis fuscata]